MENVKWLMDTLIKLHNIKSPLNFVLYFVLFVFLFLSEIRAQSIDSLINEALQNNPRLKSLNYKIISIERRAESIKVLPPPNISLEFSQVPTSSVNIFNQANSNNFVLSQMIPLGGKLTAMAEGERKNSLIQSDNYDIYKINLVAQIKTSYYSLWLIDRKIEIQRKNISLLNDLIKSIEVSYYTNKINQVDMLTIQSEIALNETQLLISEKQREAEVYKLNKLLGRNIKSKDVYVVRDFEIPTLEMTQSRLEEILSQSNPSLKKMNSMISMNEAMIEANNRELIPDLMIQGMLMRMPRGMFLTSKSNLSMLDTKTDIMYSLMFSINLPFAPWSIKKYKSKEEELSAGIRSIEYEKNDMIRELLTELNSALVKYNTAINLVNLYTEKVIPLYTKAVESQLTAYLNNKTNLASLIDSYRMLLMQQMNLLMAKADVQMAIAEIEMVNGTFIKNQEVSK